MKALLLALPISLLSVPLAPAVECPTPGQTCKVLILTPEEENALVTRNGVLDTAAQGRALELNGFVVYFKQKLAAAPAGEVKPAEPIKPVDKP